MAKVEIEFWKDKVNPQEDDNSTSQGEIQSTSHEHSDNLNMENQLAVPKVPRMLRLKLGNLLFLISTLEKISSKLFQHVRSKFFHKVFICSTSVVYY